MSGLKERVAYLQGLASSYRAENGSSKESRVIAEMLDVMDLMAKRLHEIEVEQDELKVYVESLDSDLAELEDDYYEDLDEDEEWELECPHCGSPMDEDEGGEGRVDLICPECGTLVNHSPKTTGGE